MIELIGAISTLIAIAGVVLNNRRVRWCFALWLVSNGISAFIHARTGIWSLFARDAVFFVLAIEGWIRWRTKP